MALAAAEARVLVKAHLQQRLAPVTLHAHGVSVLRSCKVNYYLCRMKHNAGCYVRLVSFGMIGCTCAKARVPA